MHFCMAAIDLVCFCILFIINFYDKQNTQNIVNLTMNMIFNVLGFL